MPPHRRHVILVPIVQPASASVGSGLDLYFGGLIHLPQIPLKPATTVNEQIALMRGRGMQVDEELARQWLPNVGYYRLSAYWYPARTFNLDGTRNDTLSPGITFLDVAELYEADRKLRTLIHDGIERIEISLRSRVCDEICHPNPLQYEQQETYRPDFDLGSWLSTAIKRVHRARYRNEAIRHYEVAYGGRYPFWVLAEVLDFSDISRLYQGLLAMNQRHIAEELGIAISTDKLTKNQRQKANANPPLVRWLHQLTIVRNTCAHHSRLWNISFTPAPTTGLRTMAELSSLPTGQNERIFGVLVVMAHLLRIISPGTSWPAKVSRLINNDFLINPLVTPEALGIPEDWNGSF